MDSTLQLMTAVRSESLDVISLLLESGADTEIADERRRTPLFFAKTAAVTNALIQHGANVNHRDISGRTPLFYAILRLQHDVVEYLISNGADVNICTRRGNNAVQYTHYLNCRFTPLQEAWASFRETHVLTFSSSYDRVAHRERFQKYFDIIRLIVPLCDDFASGATAWPTEPCVMYFLSSEIRYGWNDLIATKYLLRHGACVEFYRLYDYIFTCKFKIECFTEAFLKLTILAGCKFERYFSELKSAANRRPAHSANALLVRLIQKQVMDLFSLPLTLQELSLMTVRQCIGSRQLWAKIDSLTVPRLVKNQIKLKTYSESGRIDFDFKSSAYGERPLTINVCKSIL